MGIQLIVLAVACFLSFGAGWKVDAWKNKAETAANVEKAQALQAQAQTFADKVSTDFQAALAKNRPIQRTYYNATNKEVVTNSTVYTNPLCDLPESGRLLRNDRIDSANNFGGSPAGVSIPPEKRK